MTDQECIQRKQKMEKMAAIKIIRKIEMMTTHEQGNKCAVVLDTLQVSMHPDVGPDTSGTRTIMVPVIGY